MRNTRPYLLLLGFIIFVGLGSTLNRSQPPLGRTGAPSESTCANGCHGSSVNNGPGSINLNNPTQYTPGQTYSLTLQLTDNTKTRFGFEMTALNATNAAAGTFAVTSGNATTRTGTFGGGLRRYVHHSNGSSNNSWGISWTAPTSNVGNVTFYVAGNAANANGGTGGDNVYTQSFTMTPAAQPPVAAFTTNKSQLCDGETVTFQDNTSGNVSTLAWDFGVGASPSTAIGAGPHTVTYTGAGTPEAKLVAAGPGGISRDSVSLEVFGLPSADIIAPSGPLCEGILSTMTSLAPPMGNIYTYLWSSNSTADSAQVSTGGTYTLAITDQNGCQAADTLTLAFNPIPTPTIQPLAGSFCSGTDPVSLAASPTGGIFSGNGVLAGDNFDPDSAGFGSHTIVYTYTSVDGCVGTDMDTVEVFETPHITASTLPNSICEDADAVTLQSTPMGGVFSGSGVMGNSFAPNLAGLGLHTVEVIVTGGGGCADTATFDITVNPLPTASISAGAAGTIETQPGFSVYSWAFVDTLSGNTTTLPGFNMPNFDPTPFANSSSNTGVMIVTVTDSFGCSGTSEPFVLPSTSVEMSLFSKWNVFPNPTANKLNIQFDLLQPSRIKLVLFDAKGAVLENAEWNMTTQESMQWDISNLPAGMYFLQVQTEQGSVVEKVVKK